MIIKTTHQANIKVKSWRLGAFLTDSEADSAHKSAWSVTHMPLFIDRNESMYRAYTPCRSSDSLSYGDGRTC